MTQRFDSLVAEKEELQDALLEFHEDHIMARFPLWDCESPPCNGSVLPHEHDQQTIRCMQAAEALLRVGGDAVQTPTTCMSRHAAL